MKSDDEFRRVLAEKTEHYRDRVPVYEILHHSKEFQKKRILDLARRFAQVDGSEGARVALRRGEDKITAELAENGRLTVHLPSGAVAGERGWSPMQNLISADAGDIDRESLIRQAHGAVEKLGLDKTCTEGDELRFERLWLLKASGMTTKGERGPVALARAVGAFRRYLGGLPVWGRASIFTKIAAEGQIDAFGIDWRPVRDEPRLLAEVIDPEEGAKRVLDELQTTLPGGRFTLEDFEPQFFAMGYFSFPKRRAQTLMQPVYVAMLRPRGWTSMGHLIVVPAMSTPLEPICRLVQHHPFEKTKPIGRRNTPNVKNPGR